jgi:hypothetical protein
LRNNPEQTDQKLPLYLVRKCHNCLQYFLVERYVG